MKIQLSKYEVEIKDELSFWDEEEIKSSMFDGVKMNNKGLSGISGEAMLRAKLKAFKKAIISIKEGDKNIDFSEDWVKGLSGSDGKKLDSAIDSLSKKK